MSTKKPIEVTKSINCYGEWNKGACVLHKDAILHYGDDPNQHIIVGDLKRTLERYERLKKWAEDARGYVVAMMSIQGSPIFIKSIAPTVQTEQIAHAPDVSVEQELLAKFEDIMPEQGK